jgi:hypothetical protein
MGKPGRSGNLQLRLSISFFFIEPRTCGAFFCLFVQHLPMNKYTDLWTADSGQFNTPREIGVVQFNKRPPEPQRSGFVPVVLVPRILISTNNLADPFLFSPATSLVAW